ncbi:MAG: Spy/CpxP family protein refolding chaperone [Magnetospirillum sp.]|nr:Spy/CpxP family protein refolding chaperone [Magnetospirillum sp.]
MTSFPRLTATLAVIIGLAGTIGAVVAAEQPVPRGPERMARHCGDMGERFQARLAYSEVKLKLTEAQKAEFKQLAETMKASSEPMRKLCEEKSAKAEAATLPERLTRMQAYTEARAESMRKLVPVMAQFYTSLSPEQQKVADELLAPPGRGERGMRHDRPATMRH